MADGRSGGRYGRAGDWRLWLSRRDARAGERLRAAHLPLVRATVSRAAPPPLVEARGLREDLLAACAAALAGALDAYDPARGVAFGTLAIGFMRQAVRHVLRADDHIPEHYRLRARGIPDARRLRPASLESPVATAAGYVSLAEMLPAPDDPARAVLARDEAARVRAAVGALPGRERTLIVRRYWGEMPLRACGAGLRRGGGDLGHNGAAHVHARALARLRRKMGD